MLSLLISLIVSAAAVAACTIYRAGTGGTVAAGTVAFFAAQFLTGWIVRKRIIKVQEALQEKLLQGRKQVERKIQMFQSRPGGNIKQIQRQLESDQKALVKEALAFISRFEPFRRWNLLMGRQIATMRMQFLYQLKDFAAVDEMLASKGLFKGPMMMEPITIAMKMARQYEQGDIAGLEKTFKRHIKWMRGNRGTLLYAVMSWVYMKQGEPEKARQLLVKAKEITADKTLAYNWEMLANNKDRQFSNDGLGEEWFGLYLEAPPVPKQQRIRVNPHGRRPF